MLTGRSGNLVEFRHVLTENSQEKNDHLRCLSQCLKKLQNDVNSCLTDIINQESTSTVPAKGKNQFEFVRLFIVFIVLAPFYLISNPSENFFIMCNNPQNFCFSLNSKKILPCQISLVARQTLLNF